MCCFISSVNSVWKSLISLAGEFFVMAATLLEIKTRMMLPKPPSLDDEEEGEDPRADLAQRLLEYERFKSLVPMLQGWEEERARCFLRNAQDVEELYETPVAFGQASAQSLLKAFTRVLQRALESEPEVTSVHRKKLSLHLAMRLMMARITEAGPAGLEFIELFPSPIVLFDVVMTFLALLELLRQGRLDAEQLSPLAPIHIKLASEIRHKAFADNIVFSSGEE
jgi:segregation and condensation protein A